MHLFVARTQSYILLLRFSISYNLLWRKRFREVAGSWQKKYVHASSPKFHKLQVAVKTEIIDVLIEDWASL